MRQVIDLHPQAYERLHCEKRLVVVPGATHMFEEPGALDWVARLAREWFDRHVVTAPGGAQSRRWRCPDPTRSCAFPW